MDNEAIKVVFERNAFYRKMHFLALSILVLAVLVIGILIYTLNYVYRHTRPPLYFAADPISRLINVIPVDRPNLTYDEVVAWTQNAIQRSLSMDFVNYRRQLQNSQRFFTPYGWSKYMANLKANNNLIALAQRKWVVTAQIVGQPKLITQGILGGSYAWKFQMPLLMTYLSPPYDAKSKFSNPLLLTVIIQRRPILQSDNGLGILQIIGNLVITGAGSVPEISASSTG